jgi:hypothetical protein
VDSSIEHTVPIIVSAVYDYSSLQAKEEVSTTIDVICRNINQSATQNRPECLPANMETMRKMCLKIDSMPPQNQNELRISCQKLNDGSLQASCDVATTQQIQQISKSCKEMNAGQITHHDFLIFTFSELIAQSVSNDLNETPERNITKKQPSIVVALKKVVSLLKGSENKYLIWKLLSVILLFVVWYLLSDSLSDFMQNVTRMFFSAGILIFSLWVFSFVVSAIYPPDTSLLLESITGTGDTSTIPIGNIIGILPVIVLNLIGETIMIIAFACISIGLALHLIRRHFVDGNLALNV